MPCLLEPKPELLTPEYWGGVDINNPNYFAGPYIEPATPSRSERREAAGELAQVLAGVVKSGGTELRSHMEPEFDPSRIQLEDGSIVILDREFLLRQFNHQGTKKPFTQPHPGYASPPITSPYVDYWRSNIGFVATGGSNNFGNEVAIFESEEAMYGRYLSWGVLTTAKSGLRMVCTWAISAPQYCAESGGISIPLAGNRWAGYRTARSLPLDVGVAIPNPQLGKNRTIERTSEIRVIHSAQGRKGKDSRTVMERLADIASSLTPQKQPEYFPIPA